MNSDFSDKLYMASLMVVTIPSMIAGLFVTCIYALCVKIRDDITWSEFVELIGIYVQQCVDVYKSTMNTMRD